MKAIVWSQQNCQFCDMAKNLLKSKNIDFEEKKLSADGEYTKADLLAAVPHARTVPQIFIDDIYVGGFTELREYLK